MTHYSLHKLREADLLRVAERERASRAAAASGADRAGRARALVPAWFRRRPARA
ncbi:hypothetical protein GCM10009639_03980 [Kitasatospora putterlickiae]|uniref:Uncharacterized protein n=1 Tax=Kitasatospora putterlickiae TaxID=221725 RepID=A0ABP4IB76_9ACTN